MTPPEKAPATIAEHPLQLNTYWTYSWI
jgi:hypothetical protein